MSRLFIPYELLQITREKGFDQESFGYFKVRKGKLVFKLSEKTRLAEIRNG